MTDLDEYREERKQRAEEVKSWKTRPHGPTIAFIALAAFVALGIGIFARRASGAADNGTTLPSDIANVGFVVRGDIRGIRILHAEKPFDLELGNGPIHAEVPKDEWRVPAERLLERELGRYPARFLRNIKVAGIVLMQDLHEGSQSIPSLPNVGGLLLLDVHSVESDLVRVLHHELWHFADMTDDGRVSPDPSWEKLNPESFVYGSGGRSLRSSWAAKPATDLPGFVSAYATSGVEEDKAEVFAFVLARHDILVKQMENDRVLQTKVQKLRTRVAELDPVAPDALGFPR